MSTSGICFVFDKDAAPVELVALMTGPHVMSAPSVFQCQGAKIEPYVSGRRSR
jgi:hypothetical protein